MKTFVFFLLGIFVFGIVLNAFWALVNHCRLRWAKMPDLESITEQQQEILFVLANGRQELMDLYNEMRSKDFYNSSHFTNTNYLIDFERDIVALAKVHLIRCRFFFNSRGKIKNCKLSALGEKSVRILRVIRM